jgi:glucan phosphorylase
LGGTTTANDLVMTVGSVTVSGAIRTVSLAGTQLWPQSTTGDFTMLPKSVEFVQVTNTPSIGCTFQASTGNTGNVFVTPVTIVG